jgi:hypothetical protein
VSSPVVRAGGAFRSQLHPLLHLGMEPRSALPHPGAPSGPPGRFSSIGRIAEVRWKQRKRDGKGRSPLPEQASGGVRSSDGWRRQRRSERRYRRQDRRSGERAGETENRAPAFRAPTDGGGNDAVIETSLHRTRCGVRGQQRSLMTCRIEPIPSAGGRAVSGSRPCSHVSYARKTGPIGPKGQRDPECPVVFPAETGRRPVRG